MPKKMKVRLPEDCDISQKNSKIRVLIIHTQEAFEIARECWRIVHPDLQSK